MKELGKYVFNALLLDSQVLDTYCCLKKKIWFQLPAVST